MAPEKGILSYSMYSTVTGKHFEMAAICNTFWLCSFHPYLYIHRVSQTPKNAL